jgi:mannose-6-phosphate isomerase-like protein (cupin superfamily)
MEFASIDEVVRMAQQRGKRFVPLFGTGNFRSWILYFKPGDRTEMHHHMAPETFLVIQGRAAVKGLKTEERILEKNEIVFIDAQDDYEIASVGTEPLVLLGSRSEAFGGPHVTARGSADAS